MSAARFLPSTKGLLAVHAGTPRKQLLGAFEGLGFGGSGFKGCRNKRVLARGFGFRVNGTTVGNSLSTVLGIPS